MPRRATPHESIISRKAPKPVGPYVHAIHVKSAGPMLFVSGQIPIEVPAGKVFTGDIKRQAEIAFGHLKNIILDAKFSMDEVVKVTIFVTDIKSYDAVNDVYQKTFVGASLPARSFIQVAGLPQGVGIEVEAICAKAGGEGDIFQDNDFK